MEKKRCLFCSEFVPFEEESGYDLFIGCHCSPKGVYRLKSESYADINTFTYLAKSKQFPIISAYIRERTELGEDVSLTTEELDRIRKLPNIPVTIEQKEARLLQYLYRHSDGPDEPVIIHPLSQSYNITYSPNLQELVYIIEKLRENRQIVREGMSFKLTEKGWREAAASSGGRKAKNCFILLADDVQMRNEWEEVVFPKMEQCGYIPTLFCQMKGGSRAKRSIEQILNGDLVIADLTYHSPDVYFAAGYGLSQNIPVVWTIHRSSIDLLSVQFDPIHPYVWDNIEELAAMLQQKISYPGAF